MGAGGAEYRPQVSEVIPGGDDSRLWTLGSYRDAAGRPLASFTGRKLRQWPPRFGTARAAESRWDPGLAARCHALLDALGFHGISQVEVKRDHRDGRDYLIEVNPRSWLWVGLATSCGVNLPYACWLRRGGAPAHVARRAPRRAALDARDASTWRAAPASCAGASGACGAFLSSLRPPIVGRRHRPARPAAGARPLLAHRAPAPWLSCGCAWTARARPSRPGPAGCWRRSPRRSAPTPVWTGGEADLVYAPDPPRRGRSGSPPTSPPRPSSRATGPSRPSAVHRSRGLTLLFPPTHPERADPGRPGGERLLPAGPVGRAARARPGPVRPAAAGGQLVRAHRGARPGGPRRSRATSPPCAPGSRIPPPRSWGVALTHDIDRMRRRTARGLAGIARRRGPRGLAARSRWARTRGTTCPDLLETAWLRGVRSTVFLIGRNAHPLDGTPRRAYERERAGDGGRRAGRRRRGGPARGLRLVGGRRRPGRRARRPARRGRARSPACASTTCASATTRPCGGSRRAGARVRLQPRRSARPRGSRRASRGPSGPTWWARSARPP